MGNDRDYRIFESIELNREATERFLEMLESPAQELPEPKYKCERGKEALEKALKHPRETEKVLVLSSFVTMVAHQLEGTGYMLLTKPAAYGVEECKSIVPEISIVGNVSNRDRYRFFEIPVFVLEVPTSVTEEHVRGISMEEYGRAGIGEYWIVDIEKRQVEVYMPNCEGKMRLCKIIEEDNKEELKIETFPTVQVSFDRLFLSVAEADQQ